MAGGTIYSITGFDENGNPQFDPRMQYYVRYNSDYAEAQANQANNWFNYNMARQQNDWNTEFWQKQMDYNSPAAQKQRMLDAGLNPLFYSGQMSNGNVDSMPQAASVQGSAPHFHESGANYLAQINGFLDSTVAMKQAIIADKRADAEIRHLNSQDQNLLAQNDEIASRIHLTRAQVLNLQKDLDVKNSEISVNAARYRELLNSGDEKAANALLAQAKTKTENAFRDVGLANLLKDGHLKDVQINEICARVVNLQDEHIKNGKAIDAAEMNNIMQFIELQYKEANMDAEYNKRSAEIIHMLYGVAAPVVVEGVRMHNNGSVNAHAADIMQGGHRGYEGLSRTPQRWHYTPGVSYGSQGFSYINP